MLHAGLVLVRLGEAAFRAEPDPFGTGSFGLARITIEWRTLRYV
jgi:hypothetical protein